MRSGGAKKRMCLRIPIQYGFQPVPLITLPACCHHAQSFSSAARSIDCIPRFARPSAQVGSYYAVPETAFCQEHAHIWLTVCCSVKSRRKASCRADFQDILITDRPFWKSTAATSRARALLFVIMVSPRYETVGDLDEEQYGLETL